MQRSASPVCPTSPTPSPVPCPTEVNNRGTFIILPQEEKDTRKLKYLTATEEATRILKAGEEDYQIAYANFCPAHAHTFCGTECKKWNKIIKARMAGRERVKADAEEKMAVRKAKFHKAQNTSQSKTRF